MNLAGTMNALRQVGLVFMLDDAQHANLDWAAPVCGSMKP
jgi:hypothetical protein